MYRLLLPGIRIKRWILVNMAGMVLFALGFVLFLPPTWDLHAVPWRLWLLLSHHDPVLAVPLAALVLLLTGVALVAYGTRRLIRAFTSLPNPSASGKQLLQALVERHRATPRLKFVGIGGGTGLSMLLRGLKAYPVDLTAIVTVSDDGGSSGRLRADLDMPPPGDIRNCLVALAEAEPLMERLFQYRFSLGGTELEGHSLGNLIIAGLSQITGDFQQAIQEASHVLAVRGRVLPSATCALALKATMADGREVEGETAITAHGGTIVSISLDPPDVAPLPEALDAIREADVIILGPGSVYSSLLPNLMIPGMAEALAASPAIKFFVCNVMTQPGESDNFSAARHLSAVLEHLPCANPFHFAVVNRQHPPQDVAAFYAEKGQQFVTPDLGHIRALGTTPVTGDLLAPLLLARHDPEKLALCILDKVAEEANWPSILQRRA